jgi:hypothetical protein
MLLLKVVIFFYVFKENVVYSFNETSSVFDMTSQSIEPLTTVINNQTELFVSNASTFDHSIKEETFNSTTTNPSFTDSTKITSFTTSQSWPESSSEKMTTPTIANSTKSHITSRMVTSIQQTTNDHSSEIIYEPSNSIYFSKDSKISDFQELLLITGLIIATSFMFVAIYLSFKACWTFYNRRSYEILEFSNLYR